MHKDLGHQQSRRSSRRGPAMTPVGLFVAAALLVAPVTASALSGIALRSLCDDLAAGAGDLAAAAKHRADGDAAFAKRADPAQADVAVKAYGASLAADGRQADVRVRLSRLHYLIGDGRHRFAEDEVHTEEERRDDDDGEQ